MPSPPSTSVLLPTVTWTTACREVAEQLGPDDELLVICDAENDPVTDHVEASDDQTRLLVAGEPAGCSGKANAIAVGMAAARNERVVWTDDDFHHPDDWLDSLHRAYDEHGPVSELPFFVGRDPLSMLLEPIYALGGTLGAYTSGKSWAGAVMFERDDIDAAAFLEDLTRTISDDGLLSEYLDVTPLKRVRHVRIGGTFRETLERHVRFTQIVHRHGPQDTLFMGVVLLGMAALCVHFPLPAFVGTGLLVAAVYAFFGVWRWTPVLAIPAILVQVPLLVYALARRTFVWGGRRYRWRSKFDVEIVD